MSTEMVLLVKTKTLWVNFSTFLLKWKNQLIVIQSIVKKKRKRERGQMHHTLQPYTQMSHIYGSEQINMHIQYYLIHIWRHFICHILTYYYIHRDSAIRWHYNPVHPLHVIGDLHWAFHIREHRSNTPLKSSYDITLYMLDTHLI